MTLFTNMQNALGRYSNFHAVAQQARDVDPNAGLMLAHRLRGWANINPELAQLSCLQSCLLRSQNFQRGTLKCVTLEIDKS